MSNDYIYVGRISNPYSFGNSVANNAGEYAPQLAAYTGGRLANQYQKEQGNEETLLGALGGAGVFMGAMQLPKVFAYGNTKRAIKNANSLMKDVYEAEGFKKLSATEKNKAYSEIFEIGRQRGISVKALQKAGRTPEEIKEIKTLFETAKSNYQNALKAGDTVKAAQHAAEMKTVISAGKKQGWFSRLFYQAPKLNDINAVKTAVNNAGAEAAKAAEAVKAVKVAKDAGTTAKAVSWTKDALKSGGAKGFAIFSGVIEGLTEVLPAFLKGRAKEGTKQVAKSAVTVAADVAGWCVGAKFGAAVGAAIGSIIPGAGTAVGAAIGGVVGFVGGIVGSHFARKGVKAVIGKSFSEKEAEKEKQMAQVQTAQAEAYQQAQAAQPIKQRQAAFKAYPNPAAGLPAYATNPFATKDLLGLDSLNYDFSNPAGLYV